MANLAFGADFSITTAGAEIVFQLAVRWIHFVAGITWIGLLYFFNLVNIPFMKTLEPEIRAKVFPGLMTRSMVWFRWSALVTVVAGFFYWSYFIVAADAHNAHLHGLETAGRMTLVSFLVIWSLAFAIEMAVLMSPLEALRRGPIFGTIIGIVVVVAAYTWLALNSHGWESSRLQSIGIGGGIGLFMLLNVWGVIWRIQKKLIAWTAESVKNGTPMPEMAAKLAKQAVVVSRVNLFLSFPMLLFMAAASHYPFIVD
ncbi:MAG: urate hydroxylase PuuD [Terriglobales bacterium]